MSVLKKFRKKAQATSTGPIIRAPRIYKWGEFRSDEKGNSYWMEPDALNELAVLNHQIDDDGEFYKAFADLRKRHGIGVSRESQTVRKETFGGVKTYSWEDPTKKKSYMSEWWGGYKSWGTWNGARGNDAKMAVALRAAGVVLDVIDDTPGARMTIQFATENDGLTSFTDFKNNKTVVTPMALLDTKVKEGDAIDITNGITMHEASHGKYTRPLAKDMTAKPIEPMTIASFLLNIMEDVRIEALTSEEFPGFAAYFDKASDYMRDRGAQKPDDYGPGLAEKLNAVIWFAKWPDKVAESKFDVERTWWRDWLDRYLAQKMDYRAGIEEAMAHLRMPTPQEEKDGKSKPDPKSENGKQGEAGAEMDQIAKDEKAAADFREFMRDWLEKNKDKLKEFCTHGDHSAKGEHIEAAQSQRIQGLVDEEIVMTKPPVTDDGCSTPTLLITKPKESYASKRFWNGDKDPLVSKYREAIRLRPVKPMHTIKLMKEGKVDSTQLWRWAGDDWRVFQQREIADRPQARIYLLIDMSGSMSGPKLENAQQVARLFLLALNQIDGVHTKVYGHTGDIGASGQAHIMRLWEPGDPLSRLGLIMSQHHGNNYDGYAIGWVAQQLERDSQPNEQRIVIVLSDGYPAGEGYGGTAAERHMRKVSDVFFRKGIRILQIAIDTALSDGRQARMFREFIPFRPGDRLDEIPRRLAKYLMKVL